jgi:transcriptional regulator with XRE-family HTH domain
MAVKSSGLTLNELSHRSGVSKSQLSRFLRGATDIGLESADKLCVLLGLELIQTRPPLKTQDGEDG